MRTRQHASSQLVVQAAELYYDFGLSQEEIAVLLGVSRPVVSRLLARAVATGVVHIEVVDVRKRAAQLARQLVARFGLRDAEVVPDLESTRERSVRTLGKAGARYLEHRLPKGALLGLGRGETIYHLVHALRPVQRYVTVVPLCGGLGAADAFYQVNELVRVAAQRLGGKGHSLYAPAEAHSRTLLEAFRQDPAIAETIALWDRLDWAVIGVGSVRSPHNPAFEHLIQQIVVEGTGNPEADICLRLVDVDGRACPTVRDDRLLTVELEQLRRTPVVVAVAGGLYKVPALRAALKAGVINVLITDEPTAVALLEPNA